MAQLLSKFTPGRSSGPSRALPPAPGSHPPPGGFSHLGTPLSRHSQGCSEPGGQALGACAVMPALLACGRRQAVHSPAGVCAVRDCRCGDPGSPGRVSLAHTGELLRARRVPPGAVLLPARCFSRRRGSGTLLVRSASTRGTSSAGHPAAPAPASPASPEPELFPASRCPQLRLPAPGFSFSQTCTICL